MTKTLISHLHTSHETSITASTTQTQGQQPLTAEENEVSTVANANDVVTLKSVQNGEKQKVINNGANVLQIFPASGDDLGEGVNVSTTLAVNTFIIKGNFIILYCCTMGHPL